MRRLNRYRNLKIKFNLFSFPTRISKFKRPKWNNVKLKFSRVLSYDLDILKYDMLKPFNNFNNLSSLFKYKRHLLKLKN